MKDKTVNTTNEVEEFTKDLNVDMVAEEVWKVQRELMMESDSPYGKPVINVYMQRDFWEWCMVQINGSVSSAAYEFHSSYGFDSQQKILGGNVYVVNEIEHPSFKIFGELRGKVRVASSGSLKEKGRLKCK